MTTIDFDWQFISLLSMLFMKTKILNVIHENQNFETVSMLIIFYRTQLVGVTGEGEEDEVLYYTIWDTKQYGSPIQKNNGNDFHGNSIGYG